MDLMKKLMTTRSINALATGVLYRAFVVLPPTLCRVNKTFDERTVFFEAPRGSDEAAHLEQLLARAWCVDTRGWAEDGAIYNIWSAAQLFEEKPEPTVDLHLLDIGGGPDGVGPAKAYYARTPDVDLFVTPRVAMRLRELLAVVDQMYEAQPDAPRACNP